MTSRYLSPLFACGLVAALTQPGLADDKKKELPTEVSYYRDVRPILQLHCQGCHQPAKSMGGYVMTGHADLLKAGDSGEAGIIAGQPDKSLLVKQITSQDGKPPAMPKGKDPLIGYDVSLIKKWIEQGAKDDTPMSAKVGGGFDIEHPPTYPAAPVVTSIAYSPDGQLLAVAGYQEVLLHKADGSGIVGRLVGLSDRIQSIAFSPDGKLLAVAGGCPCLFGELQVWEVSKKKLKYSISVTNDTIYGVSWSPDGLKISFGCADNSVRAVDSSNGKQVLFQGAHSDWVLDTVFSTDGSHLVSVSRDMAMKLTDVSTQRFIDNVTSITPGALKGGIQTVVRHPKKDELLIGGSDGTPKIYQMYRTKKRVIGDDFNLIHAYDQMPGRIFAGVYSVDGSRIAVGTSNDGQGEVRVYYAMGHPHNNLLKMLSLPTMPHFGLSALVQIADFNKGKMICKCEGQKGAIYALSFHPNGKQVASAGFDGMIRLNDAKTGKLIKEFVPVPLSPTPVASRGAGK